MSVDYGNHYPHSTYEMEAAIRDQLSSLRLPSGSATPPGLAVLAGRLLGDNLLAACAAVSSALLVAAAWVRAFGSESR